MQRALRIDDQTLHMRGKYLSLLLVKGAEDDIVSQLTILPQLDNQLHPSFRQAKQCTATIF